MKTMKKKSYLLSLIFLSFTLTTLSFTQIGRLFSQEGLKEENWKFPKKDTLVMNTSGSTKVFISGSNSNQIEIKLKYLAKSDEKFEIKEKQEAIYLTEILDNYQVNRPTQTYFEEWTWEISVPHGTYIKCRGNSSNFEISNFNGSYSAHYASGHYVLNNITGIIEMPSASSHVEIYNSKGSFDISSASGSVTASEIAITGDSRFRSTTGSIKISLSQTPTEDLYLASTTNKVQLNFNGHDVTGYFEFIARADDGRISCPYKFDDEDTFLDDLKTYRNSSDFGKKSEYNRKSFIRGYSKPKITIRTVSGTAKLSR